MTKKEKKSKVEIVEGYPPWGEHWAVIMHVGPHCPECHSLDVQEAGSKWLCSVCLTVWPRQPR
jgi:hypothetical protein